MADEEPAGPFDRWLALLTTFIAPATLLSTVLFYFGYVSARTQYDYFGIDVDTIGLSTQDYVMRSPQPLLVPLLVLALLGLVAMASHARLNRGLPHDLDGVRRWSARVHWFKLGGVTSLAIATVVLLGYPYLGGWAGYPLATPALFILAAAVTGYSAWLTARLGGDRQPRQLVLLLVAVLIANVFWATATVAQWSGRALAHAQARRLDELPSVILDTKERLFLRDGQVMETALPAAAGQTFHFRYRGLRLLIEGKDRMFLVPEHWSASDSTLMVPIDDAMRVQFQFVNERP